MRYAANLAGIKPNNFSAAPIFSLITFDFYHKSEEEKKFLVFDYGCNSLDISLVDIDGGMIEVRSTASLPHFGGEDIDTKMMSYFAYRFQKKNKKDLRKSEHSIMFLRRVCERAKHALSISPTAAVVCESIFEGIDLVDNITKEEFEQMNEELFQMILSPNKKLLRQENISQSEFTDILLFVSSSRIPRIGQILSEFFDGKNYQKESI